MRAIDHAQQWVNNELKGKFFTDMAHIYLSYHDVGVF